jgi:polyisoprenoid-binding protein YceI
LVTSTAFAAFAPLKLDTVHSKVSFTAATVLFDVDGDASKPQTVKVEANIDVASLNTNNVKRDNHLKSPDFFDAAKYPMIRFASTGVKMQRRRH